MLNKYKKNGKILGILFILIFIFVFGTVNAAEVTLKFGHGGNTLSELQLLAEVFERLVEDRTNGEIDVIVYPSTLTASSEEAMGFLKAGSIDMYEVYAGHIAGFCEDVQFLNLPYLFNNDAHFAAAKNSRPIQIILNEIEEATNLEVLGVAIDMNGLAIASIEPIRSFEECKNVKLRCMQNPLFVDMYANFGFQPTGTDWGELYTSLQTGLVQANDLGVKCNYEYNFNEVVNSYAITRHFWSQMIIMANRDSLAKLTPEHKEIVLTSMDEACQVTDAYTLWVEELFIEKAIEDGATVTYPDLKPFKEASQITNKKWFAKRPRWEGWYNEIQSLDPEMIRPKAETTF